MTSLDQSLPTSPELISQPKKSAAERINKIYEHGLQHGQALKTWKSDNAVREKQGLDAYPEPPKPEDYELYKILSNEESTYHTTAQGHLKDIEEGGHPEKYSLGLAIDRSQADQRLKQGQAAIDVMITEAGSYNGDSEKELIEAVRIKGILGAVFDQGNTKVATEIIRKYPESLNFFPEYTSRLLNNLGNDPFRDQGNLNSEYVQTVLTALVGETSSLSPKEREQAKYYLSETRGFNLFQVLQTSNQVSTSTIKELIGFKESSFYLEPTQPQEGAWPILYGLVKLSKEDNNNGLSQLDRDQLQAVVIGYAKAEILLGNQLESPNRNKSNPSEEDKRNFGIGQAKKASAIKLLTELLDKNTTFDDVVYNKISNPSLSQQEIKRIYNDPRCLFGLNQEVQKIIFQHDNPITNKRREEMKQQAKEADDAAKKEADKARAAEEAAKAAELASAIEKFNSSPIQDILQGIDYSSIYPTEEPMKILFSMFQSKQLDQSQFDFISQVFQQINSLRPANTGIVSSSVEEVIDTNGFLGIGKKTHQETIYTSDHSKVKSMIDDMVRGSGEKALNRNEQAKKLALEFYLRLPDSNNINQ